MALSSFNAKIRGLQRLLVGHADDVEIDAAGPHPRAARAAPIRGPRQARRAGRARQASSSCGTTRSGRARPRRRSRFPRTVCRPSWTASPFDAGWCARPRPARRSRGGAGGQARRRLRRRHLRPRRSCRARSSRGSGPHGRLVAHRSRSRRCRRSARASRSAFRFPPRVVLGAAGRPRRACASRRSTACSSISASPRRRSTMPRAASRFAPTDRSTCGWTRRAASPPRDSSPAPPRAN